MIFYSSIKHIPCCCHLRSTPSICSLELLVLGFVLWRHLPWFFDDVSSWIIVTISSTTSVVVDSKSSTELRHFFQSACFPPSRYNSLLWSYPALWLLVTASVHKPQFWICLIAVFYLFNPLSLFDPNNSLKLLKPSHFSFSLTPQPIPTLLLWSTLNFIVNPYKITHSTPFFLVIFVSSLS